jgi:mycothiol system anti-sigma-R factor
VSDVNDEAQKTDCSVVISEVYLYLDLECSDDRRDLIQRHLDDCSDCLREYGIEHEVKALVARCCGDERAPRELRERLRLKLNELVIDVETREYLP